jgi:hypothetical protein
MDIQRQILGYIFCLFTLLGCSPAPSSRNNELAKLYPSKLAGLDATDRKMATEYVTRWMKIFSILGTGGISRDEILKGAYDEELLPVILPLKGGTGVKNEAYEASVKIYEALNYLGTCLREKKTFDNSQLNLLLRYELGHETSPKLMSEGIGELLFDYFQLVDPTASYIAMKAKALR